MRHIQFFVILSLAFLTGCSGYRNIEIPESEEDWITEGMMGSHPERMYTRQAESKYVIKEEPYGLKSKKKDPELLGPQRTYKAKASQATHSVKQKKHVESRMTKSSCISLIGEAKYNSYVQKYGGEKGALRRCLIIKRLRG